MVEKIVSVLDVDNFDCTFQGLMKQLCLVIYSNVLKIS